MMASPSGRRNSEPVPVGLAIIGDRKSTRLNSSHLVISYAVFCLKKNRRDLCHLQAVETQFDHAGIHLDVNARDCMPARGRLTILTPKASPRDIAHLVTLPLPPAR